VPHVPDVVLEDLQHIGNVPAPAATFPARFESLEPLHVRAAPPATYFRVCLQLQKCGKMIVAVSDDELPRLDKLYERDVANGVKHLVYMSSLPRSSHTAPHWPWFGNLSNYYIFFLSTLSVAEEE
jgi:hypothetical protein